LLFLSATVNHALGIKYGVTASYSLISIAFLMNIIETKNFIFISKNKNELIFLLTIFLISIFRFVLKDLNTALNTLTTWFLPVLLLLYLNKLRSHHKINIIKIILFFFTVECLLSIYEKTFNYIVFPIIDEDVIEIYSDNLLHQFRSNAIWGNPLMNANIVSIILSFIIVSTIKFKYKLFFYIIGIYSLLAFNARGALVIWIVITLIAIFTHYKNIKNNNKFTFFITSLIVIFLITYSMINTDWGGRLIYEDKLYDESAQSRVFSFYTLFNISFNQLLVGAVDIKNYTENGYINILLNYGLILGLILIVFQLIIFFRYIKKYSFWSKTIIFLAFIGVGSLNNNLQQSTPFMFFILCVTTFSVLNSNYNVLKHTHINDNTKLKTK